MYDATGLSNSTGLGSFWVASSLTQLLKNFPTFYGIRRFIIMLTKPSPDPYPEPDDSNLYNLLLSLRSILLLSSHLRLGLPSDLTLAYTYDINMSL
jgi:hypothetical protein